MTPATDRLMAELRSLAIPRVAGTPTERRLAREVADRLASVGYDVRDEPFTFDPRWVRRGYPFVILAAAALVLLTPFSPSPVTMIGVVCVVTLPVVVAAASGVWRFDRGAAITTSNVVATRPSERGPLTVVVAHLDSKSQRLSFASRSLAAALGAVAFFALGLAVAFWPDARVPHVTLAVACAGALVASALAGYGNASPGALDNGTGVVVLLELARRRAKTQAPDVETPAADAESRVGGTDSDALGRVEWVVTGAEEDGLVGADRFVAEHGDRLRRERAAIINLDTVGGRGPLILTTHGWRRGGADESLRGAILVSARASSIALDVKRVPFPAGVDSAVFARADLPAVTIASGTWRTTFRHVHRPTDTLDRVDVANLRRTIALVEGVIAARART